MKMFDALTTDHINRLDLSGVAALAEQLAYFVEHAAAELQRRRDELLQQRRAERLRAAILGSNPPE